MSGCMMVDGKDYKELAISSTRMYELGLISLSELRRYWGWDEDEIFEAEEAETKQKLEAIGVDPKFLSHEPSDFAAELDEFIADLKQIMPREPRRKWRRDHWRHTNGSRHV